MNILSTLGSPRYPTTVTAVCKCMFRPMMAHCRHLPVVMLDPLFCVCRHLTFIHPQLICILQDKCQVIVSDGITLGHLCCGKFWCTEPLQNNCHRYCKTHSHLYNECAVSGCDQPIVEGTKTCNHPVHRKMEALSKAKRKVGICAQGPAVVATCGQPK